MPGHVTLESSRMRELQSAHRADVGPLAGMRPHVYPQVAHLSERSIATRTVQWPLSRMQVGAVPLQLRPALEALRAVGAGVQPFRNVRRANVRPERTRKLERLAALVALVQRQRTGGGGVHGLDVIAQDRLQLEAESALAAHERPGV